MSYRNLFIFCLAICVSSVWCKKCEIPIGSKKLFSHQWPLVYTAKGDLYAITAGTAADEASKIEIPNGEEILLSCGVNYLKKYFRTRTLKVICNGNSGKYTIPEHNEELSASELTCDLRAIEEIPQEVAGCGEGKNSSSFGYLEAKDQNLHILGEVCYDTTEGRTLFVHLKMNAADSVLRKIPLTTYPILDAKYKLELFRGLFFDQIYERVRNQLHLKNVPLLKLNNFIDESMLASAQFQAVRKLGWNYMATHEDFDIFSQLKGDIKKWSVNNALDLFVGTHGTAVLKGSQNEKMELYLHQTGSEGRFPMPAYLWLLVRDKNQITGFVLSNQIDGNQIEESTSVNEFCKEDCLQISWLSEDLKSNGKRRGLSCCSYEELKAKISEIPEINK